MNELDNIEWNEDFDKGRSVASIIIDDVEWLMDIEQYQTAQAEGRTHAVIYKDKLIFVDDETMDELKVLETWLKNNN
jgi:hypothetical protein